MSESDKPDDRPQKKPNGLMRRLKKWIGSQLEEMDATEKELDRRRKELEEKNRRGARRTDGRI